MQQTIEINSVRNLLDKVSILTKKHEEIAAITGDDFNIFRILGVNYDETSYSRTIWAFLNPKGLHRQGSLYLNLFLDEIITNLNSLQKSDDNEYNFKSLIKKIESLKSLNTSVKREYHIGKVNLKSGTGGLIDILISNRSFSIAIENKINAKDQYKQVERYKEENNIVLYLTKNGTPPSKESAGSLNENKDYFCISYRDTIKNWIEKCLQVSINLPKIRETLQQFHNSINIITMTNSNKLNDEITELISTNPIFLKTISIISKYYDNGEFIKNLIFPILKNNNIQFNSKEILKRNSKKKILNWNNDFQYCYPSFKVLSHSNYNSFSFGVRVILEYYSKERFNYIKTLLENRFNVSFIGNDDIKEFKKMNFIYTRFLGFENWEEPETISKMVNGEFETELQNKLEQLKEACKEIEKHIGSEFKA